MLDSLDASAFARIGSIRALKQFLTPFSVVEYGKENVSVEACFQFEAIAGRARGRRQLTVEFGCRVIYESSCVRGKKSCYA